MKKKFFFAAVALVMSAATAVGYKAYDKGNMSEFMMANIEALSTPEQADCHYTNGYTAFKGREGSGGGFDCCMQWHNMKPDTDAPMCK